MAPFVRWIHRTIASVTFACAVVTIALAFSTRGSVVSPLSAAFPTAPGQRLERTVQIRTPGRYFLSAEFDANGPLQGVFQAFGTSKKSAIPCDLTVEIRGPNGIIIRQTLEQLVATTSSGGARGRLGFSLGYADLPRDEVDVTLENRGGFEQFASANPRFELSLNPAAFEGRLMREQIFLLVTIIGGILTGILFAIRRLNKRPLDQAVEGL